MFIGDWMGRGALYWPEQLAVVDVARGEAGRFTYRALNARAEALGGWLRDVAGVKRFLARGTDVDLRSPDGFTPLGLSVFFRQPDVARLLVEAGADVDAKASNTLQVAPIHAAVARSDFSPATSERTFSLVAGSYPCAAIAPPLVARLAAEAPLAQLYISAYTPDVFDRMDAHRVDFMVSSVINAPARFEREGVMNEDLVWVVRSDHPLAKRRHVDLDAFFAGAFDIANGERVGVADIGRLRHRVHRRAERAVLGAGDTDERQLDL